MFKNIFLGLLTLKEAFVAGGVLHKHTIVVRVNFIKVYITLDRFDNIILSLVCLFICQQDYTIST